MCCFDYIYCMISLSITFLLEEKIKSFGYFMIAKAFFTIKPKLLLLIFQFYKYGSIKSTLFGVISYIFVPLLHSIYLYPFSLSSASSRISSLIPLRYSLLLSFFSVNVFFIFSSSVFIIKYCKLSSIS